MQSINPILLVDDDLVDVMTVERALKAIKISNQLVTAGNGEEALAYLRDPEKRMPCLILLDLNMPRMNGLEFLEIIKNEGAFRRIPVVVLTSSREEKDLTASYDKCISGYIVKPLNYEEFLEVVRTINLYWTLSELPGEMGL